MPLLLPSHPARLATGQRRGPDGAPRSQTTQPCPHAAPPNGDANTGGLVGFNEPDCIVYDCFWDTQTSGINHSAEGTGLPTDRLQRASTYTRAGWDLSPNPDSVDYWVLLPEPQYPMFAWQILQADPNTCRSDHEPVDPAYDR